MNVLIIDDSPMAVRVMTRILSAEGHQVFSLPSPIGATRAVIKHAIDVVVIDVNLPSVRGDRLAGLFRANRRLDELGLVLVSGMDREELERLAEDARADAATTKADLERDLPGAVVRAGNLRGRGEVR